jgi:RNA polymerase sigma factor (sigma-70 family)
MQTGGHDAVAFRTTRWSRVARAAAPAHPGAPTALAEMCHDYWPPLYAFARRIGRSPQDAEDLTQGFFATLIEKNTLAAAEQARGKLRTFLLAAFQHHIADVAKREHAIKRGGGTETLSIDAAETEAWFACESAERETPETLYHRRWAMLLLERALDQLEAERAAAGHGAEVAVLRPFLSLTVSGAATYEEAARQLGWTPNAVRVAVFRLRARYRELLLDLVAATLDDENPSTVEAEMRELLAALS